MRRTDSFEKTLMMRKIEGRRRGWQRMRMVGWHHRLNGHESEQTLAVGDGQGGLTAVDGVTKSWTRLSNWTELKERKRFVPSSSQVHGFGILNPHTPVDLGSLNIVLFVIVEMEFVRVTFSGEFLWCNSSWVSWCCIGFAYYLHNMFFIMLFYEPFHFGLVVKFWGL